MLTMARPPRMEPKTAVAKATRRREIPERFVIAPARMKSGIAIRGKRVVQLCRDAGQRPGGNHGLRKRGRHCGHAHECGSGECPLHLQPRPGQYDEEADDHYLSREENPSACVPGRPPPGPHRST